MRAYNVMWARAKVSSEMESLLTGSSQRIIDIQKRIKRENVKLASTKQS